jgi:hypothetical protein
MIRCDDDLVKVSMCENVQLSFHHGQSHLWRAKLNLIVLRVGSDAPCSNQSQNLKPLDAMPWRSTAMN